VGLNRKSTLPWIVSFALVAAFYLWTSTSDRLSWKFGREQTDYYNLLIDGFLQGKLSLGVDVPPEILALPDPYDPDKRPPGVALHDATLYRGKYYIYFGVVPAVLTLLPFRVLTGVDLPLGVAVLSFALVGFAAQLWLLAAIRQRFFASLGALPVALLGAVVGVVSCVPILLRRSSMYDLPIASGYCFAALALACLFQVWFAAGQRMRWLVACSVCWGLAIGSRPIYLLAPGGLALVCAYRVWHAADAAMRRRLVLATFAPILLIGLLLAWYNYARFGSPAEFGLNYILSGVYEAKIDHFRPRYAAWNLHAYLFAGVEWGRYFPFYHSAGITLPRPHQHFGMDIPFGLLANLAFLWLIPAAALTWRRGDNDDERVALRLFLVSAVWAAATVLAFLLCFYAAMARYMVDFAPTLALLAAIGALGLLSAAPTSARWLRRSLAALVGAAGAISVFAATSYSAAIYQRLQHFNPAGAEAIARVVNAPVHAFERWRDEAFGPATLRVAFPAEGSGTEEELVATGRGERDRVLVSYPDRQHVRFGFEHTGAPRIWSEPLRIDRSAEHEVRVALGSLFPPSSHPVFASWSGAERAAVQRRVRLELNGRVVLDAYQRFYDSTPTHVLFGGAGTKDAFSGHILSTRRDGLVDARASARRIAEAAGEPRIEADANGALRLKVRFPALPAGRRLPVVTSGQTGRGDVLMVEFLANARIRFVLDHWGRRPYLGPELSIEPGREYRLTIQHPFYAPEGARRVRAGEGEMRIELDGRAVWVFEPLLYPVEPEDIFIGRNPIGGSGGAGEVFAQLQVADSPPRP
jgi:hypothetical protein